MAIRPAMTEDIAGLFVGEKRPPFCNIADFEAVAAGVGHGGAGLKWARRAAPRGMR